MGRRIFVSVLAALAAGLSGASAQEWDVAADMGVEARAFFSDPAYTDQLEDFQPSLILNAEAEWRSEDRKHQIFIAPFARLDSEDDRRTHGDLREAYYRYVSDGDWSVLAGVGKVFWGTTESRHLVDIVNQTDGVEDIDEEDKLGQPMVQLTWSKDWGTVDVFALPFFRDRTFAGESGRLRFAAVVSDDIVRFDRDSGREGVDVALRYSNFFGDWDVGLSAFHGLSREPRLVVPLVAGADGPVPGAGQPFAQFYDEITQGGIDVQYTKDAWLWKGEMILRDGQGDSFAAAVAGFEYTLYQLGETSWDLGLLAEYLYDGRDQDAVVIEGDFLAEEVAANLPAGFVNPALGATTVAPLTPFDNDLFLGGRLAFNDIQDTSILAGAITDTEDGSMLATVEAARRFGESWTGEMESRLFLNADEENLLQAFEEDDFLTLRLTKYY